MDQVRADGDPIEVDRIRQACDDVLAATSVHLDSEVTAAEPGWPATVQRGVVDPAARRAALLTTVSLPDLDATELPTVIDGDTLLQADVDPDTASARTWTAVEDTGMGLLATPLALVWWCLGTQTAVPGPPAAPDEARFEVKVSPAAAVRHASAGDQDAVRRSLEQAQTGLLEPHVLLDAEVVLHDGELRDVTLTLPPADAGMVPGAVPGATMRLRLTTSTVPVPIVVPDPDARTTVAGFVRDHLGDRPPS